MLFLVLGADESPSETQEETSSVFNINNSEVVLLIHSLLRNVKFYTHEM